jgi:hypothetical protein
MSKQAETLPQNSDSRNMQHEPALISVAQKPSKVKNKSLWLQKKFILSISIFILSAILILSGMLIILAIQGGNLYFRDLPSYSSDQWTAINSTQQAMDPSKTERIEHWLNKASTDFDKSDLLKQGLVGKYEIMSVSFPTDYYLEVDMNCECASGSNCCDPEEMFVLTIDMLTAAQSEIVPEVPATVQYLDVVCFDHKRVFYAMYASWDKVKEYLNQQNPDVNSLIASVRRRSLP